MCLKVKPANAKSRGGCKRCKVRRVKCGQQRPWCTDCIRRNETCEYPTWSVATPASAAAHINQRGDRKISSVAPSRSMKSYAIGDIEKPLNPLSISDLILRLNIHHTFGPDQSGGAESKLWKGAILPNAARYDFVNHCLSSILRLLGDTEDTRTERATDTAAYQRHLTALSSFRNAEIQVDQSNWAVIILFGCSVIIFEFGAQQICPNSMFDYMGTFHTLRMSAHMIASIEPFLKHSRMWEYIQLRTTIPGPLKESLVALNRLQLAIESSHFDANREEKTLLDTAQALNEWTVSCDASPSTWWHYIAFPSAVPPEYLHMLATENDLALLLLIHWCAVMQLGNKRWFLKDWPQRAASFAISKLSAEWNKLLAWPCSVFDDLVIFKRAEGYDVLGFSTTSSLRESSAVTTISGSTFFTNAATLDVSSQNDEGKGGLEDRKFVAALSDRTYLGNSPNGGRECQRVEDYIRSVLYYKIITGEGNQWNLAPAIIHTFATLMGTLE